MIKKGDTFYEYMISALKNIDEPIGAATYQLRNTLPKERKVLLLEQEEIAKKLRLFEE